MQVSSHSASVAAKQIAESIEMLNQLNQTIVDKSQDMSGKLLRVAVENKITSNENTQKLDLLA